jgi:hypothetical protein
LDQKKKRILIEQADRGVLAAMILGIVLLFQPFSMTLFTLGFPLLILTFLVHSVLDHL